jgi:L-fuconolactonase
MRVDSHQHFWKLARGDYGWLTNELASLYRDFLPADLEPALARHRIDATVLVQAAPTVAETRFLLGLADAHDFIAGVVGWVDFESAGAAATIVELASHRKLVGLRPMLQDLPDDAWLLRESLAPAVDALQGQGLVFDALVKPRHLAVLRQFIEKFPRLKIVVDHGAKPDIRRGEFDAWARDIRAIARHPQVHCKLSGLVTEAGNADAALLAPYVEHLLASFGAARLLWGSDWPVSTQICDYDSWLDCSEKLLAGCGVAERAAIFGGNAQEIYALGSRQRQT